jgi:hypothetical protein
MRVLISILFLSVAGFAEDPQPPVPPAQVSENFTIPARLAKTVDTKKCKAGDVVEMRTLEPVLIGNGLVMPEHTRLQATVLGAASRQNEKPSWLVLVVQKAEWKDHSVPLRAFVTSQITVKPKPGQNDSPSTASTNMSDFEHGRYTPRLGNSLSSRSKSFGRVARDATDGGDAAPDLSHQRLDDLYMQQARNGMMFLLSPKRNLKLPSGTMFMLRNQPAGAPAPAQAVAQKATGSTQ